VSELRAVICDFGGVLTTPLFQAFARVQDDSGVPVEALGKALVRIAEQDGAHPLWELEKGRMSEPDFVARLERAVGEQLGRPVALHDFSERYWSHLHPNEELIAYMRGLRERGYAMALLTNNVREWEPRWRAMLPVDEIFPLVVDSAFVGMRKPEPEIYSLTLQRLRVPAAECLFLDDIELNCETARELGMTAVVFHDTAQAIAEVEAALDAGS
jgi:putative hydrolase of the HAD superfamily